MSVVVFLVAAPVGALATAGLGAEAPNPQWLNAAGGLTGGAGSAAVAFAILTQKVKALRRDHEKLERRLEQLDQQTGEQALEINRRIAEISDQIVEIPNKTVAMMANVIQLNRQK